MWLICPSPAPAQPGGGLGGLPPLCIPSLQRAEPSTHPWLGTHLGLSVRGGCRVGGCPRGARGAAGGPWGLVWGLVCIGHFWGEFRNCLQSLSGGEGRTKLPSPQGQ